MYALRPARVEDGDAIYEILAASMGSMLERVMGWGDEQLRDWHENRWMTPEHLEITQIVEIDGEPAGLLEVERPSHELHIARIEIHPKHQGRGIGGELIRGLQREAAEKGMPVTLDVFKINPAMRLYQRLGFRVTGETDERRWRMRWEGNRA